MIHSVEDSDSSEPSSNIDTQQRQQQQQQYYEDRTNLDDYYYNDENIYVTDFMASSASAIPIDEE